MTKIIGRIAQVLYVVYVTLVFAISFIVFMPFFVLFSFCHERLRNNLYFYLIKIWSRVIFIFFGFTVRITGKNNIDKTQKYVVVANHYSYLDSPMIFRTLPFFAKPLAREDYGKIPLFGYLYRRVTIPVARESISSKKKSFQKLIQTVNDENTSVFIFPEGSFNQTDQILKPFFDGAFRIAKETNTPILPILFPDTIKRWHFSSFWKWTPGISRAIILPPIDVDTISTMDHKELKELVYNQMLIKLSLVDK